MFGAMGSALGAAMSDPRIRARFTKPKPTTPPVGAMNPNAVPMGLDANAVVTPGQPLQAAQPMGMNPSALAAASGAAVGLGGGMMGGIDPNALAQFFARRQQPQPPVLGMPGYNSLPTRPRNPQREAFMQQLMSNRGRFGGMFGGF